MKKSQFDAIVIGGGLGGLTAGALLSKRGRKVLLLEQHYIPGGCATSFKRKDFVIEVGLHEMDGLDKLDPKTKLFEELGVFNNITLQRVPDFYRIINMGSFPFDVTIPDNTERAIDKLSKIYPDEKRGINTYFKTITSIRKEVMRLGKLKQWQKNLLMPLFPVLFPHISIASGRVIRWTTHMNPLFWLLRPRFLFRNEDTLGALMDNIIKNEELKVVLMANLGYYHDDPYTMSFIYHSVAQDAYYGGGGYFIQGGSQKLSDYLADVIRSHRGVVLQGKYVSEIIVDNRKAVGVKYRNAFEDKFVLEEAFAEVIIANAAIPNVVNMLPPKSRKLLAGKVSKCKQACSLLSIYIGFKKNLKNNFNNQTYSTFLFQDIDTQKKFAKTAKRPIEKRGFVFVDYSQLDSRLTPEGKSLGVICTWDYLTNWSQLSDEEYIQEKERVANVLIKQLEHIIPGISKEVEYYEVATPKTINRYTLNPGGTPYGFAQIPEQAGTARISNRSPIQNLYFSSAWAFPGAGFTGAILSGQTCAEKILDCIAPSQQLVPDTLKDTQTAKLISTKEIAANTIEMVFEKPSDFERFQPGQYACVTLEQPTFTELDMPLRLLSIASHPDEPVLRFAMRKSDSSFKRSCKTMQPGETAKIYGPAGSFTLRKGNKKVAFLAAGIGITPIVSMIKELEKRNNDNSVHLFYSNKTVEETAYHTYFNSISMPAFSYHPVFTKTQKRLGSTTILDTLKTLEDTDFYIVGSVKFVRVMKEILEKGKVKKEDIIAESFG